MTKLHHSLALLCTATGENSRTAARRVHVLPLLVPARLNALPDVESLLLLTASTSQPWTINMATNAAAHAANSVSVTRRIFTAGSFRCFFLLLSHYNTCDLLAAEKCCACWPNLFEAQFIHRASLQLY